MSTSFITFSWTSERQEEVMERSRGTFVLHRLKQGHAFGLDRFVEMSQLFTVFYIYIFI